MVKLLRLLKGYICFCASGGFPERFINLCQLNGVVLWNVKNDGVKVYACTSSAQYNDVINAAENSGMELNVIKEKGLKYFVKRNKSRVGVFVGIIFLVAFLIFMSGFIWEVEIAENAAVNVEAFTEDLADLGVKIGARKSKIDIQQVQQRLMDKHKELLWVSLNIFGGKAYLEMSIVTPEEEIIDTDTPVNIIAKKNGEIVLVRGLYGVNAVKEGVNVTQGSLLISGIGTYADGTEYFVHAKGEVLARTKTTLKNKSVLQYKAQSVLANKSSYKLMVFGLGIPLTLKAEGEYFTSEAIVLQSKKAVLPLGVERTDGFSAVSQKVNLTQSEGTYIALLDTVLQKRADFLGAKLEKVTYSVTETAVSAEVLCKVLCVEDIAKEVEISLEQ